MIRKIDDITQYLPWIDAYIGDPAFSSPFCNRERVLSVSNKDENVLLGAYQDNTLTGIFCLMVLDSEKTIETIFLYSKDSSSYEELIEYLSEKYRGYESWFVFNPKNVVLKDRLFKRNAVLYPEQRYMDFQGTMPFDTDEVIPYSEDYKEEYVNIHSKDGYWTGEKVLEQMDAFDIFLCIREKHLVGYIDLSKGDQLVEIMDIAVSEKYRNQGIGALLLRKAICFEKGKRLILTVDVDNAPANHLYEKMGFLEIRSNNCLTAECRL